jgi:hypothetical protein
MMSYVQELNGLDVLVKFKTQYIFYKYKSKPPQHLLSIIDLAKWAPRIKKI